MTENPYAAPEANVDAPPQTGAPHHVNDPRSVSAGRGWQWIAGGFRYFAARPLPWILAILAWFGVLIVASQVPVVNIVITVITPVIFAGYMIGCDAEDRGERFAVGHAFAGFQETTPQLFMVGGLYLLGTLVLAFISVVLLMVFPDAAAVALALVGEGGGENITPKGILIAVLIAVGLGVPLLMAFYFAPPLIALGKLRPVEAIKLSFIACLRNMLPFQVFGIVLLVFAILAIIPLMMGFLVLAPVMVAAVYTAYQDIFINQQDALLGPGQ